jgi:hypothetical protein
MHSFFNVSGRATPHFYVGRDGELEQYIDTDHGSSANLDGNHDCITVETWDGFPVTWGGGGNGPPWTEAQIRTLARLAAWCNTTHDIPLVQLPSSRPGTRGIGWHRLGCDGNYEDPPGGLLGGRVSGGEKWSTSPGKVCPTTTRIRQVVNDIIPLAKNGGGEDDDMALDDKVNAEHTVKQVLNRLDRYMSNSAKREGALLKLLNTLPNKVADAVDAALPDNVPGVSLQQIRTVVRNHTEASLREVLGGLDNPKEK